MRILLIEDDVISQEATRELLVRWGYQVVPVETGEEGVLRLESEAIDIVVSDLGLPDMSYDELLRRLRERSREVPIILLSGETGSDVVFGAIHHGVFDFVPKFEHNSLLRAALNRAAKQVSLTLENRELLERLQSMTAWLELQVAERTSALEQANQRLRNEIDERQRMEAELRLAQKLEAVGQLAAGIAHEINTPIQFVGDSLHFVADGWGAIRSMLGTYREALSSLQDAPTHAEVAEQVSQAEEESDLAFIEENTEGAFTRALEGIERITGIVRALKEFAHPDSAEKSPADLNRALMATLTIARNEYKYVAEVETELGELPPVMCHLGDINQVVLNLLVNAAHAIGDVVKNSGERGKIFLKTSREDRMVRISVRDTGCGIPEEIRGRIFDPFFTTKEVGRGSGQGLAIARTIVVEKHHGSLTFVTEVGRGTTFELLLPIDGKLVEPASR